jgi:hypothetical protein
MERIRKGNVKPGVSLDVSSYKQIKDIHEESKSKKVKRLNK